MEGAHFQVGGSSRLARRSGWRQFICPIRLVLTGVGVGCWLRFHWMHSVSQFQSCAFSCCLGATCVSCVYCVEKFVAVWLALLSFLAHCSPLARSFSILFIPSSGVWVIFLLLMLSPLWCIGLPPLVSMNILSGVPSLGAWPCS